MSKSQLGCVLLQDQEDKVLTRIGYGSRLLFGAGRNYNKTRKECLVVIRAVLIQQPYLEGTSSVVRINHQELRWVLGLKECTGCLTRWWPRLLEFDFKVVRIPGSHHQVPKAIPWIPEEPTGVEKALIDGKVPSFDLDIGIALRSMSVNTSWC